MKNEKEKDYTRLIGPFLATSNPISKNTPLDLTFTYSHYPSESHNVYANEDEDKDDNNNDNTAAATCTSTRTFGIYILHYCDNEDIGKNESCEEDAFYSILKNHEEQWYDNVNVSNEKENENKKEALLGDTSPSCPCPRFYIVVVSMDEGSVRQKMVAMYEIVHDDSDSDSAGVNSNDNEKDKDNTHCDKDREGDEGRHEHVHEHEHCHRYDCYHYHNLFIQTRNENGKNNILIGRHQYNPDRPRPKNSNVFLLRQRQGQGQRQPNDNDNLGKRKRSLLHGHQQTKQFEFEFQFNFSMKTVFEYDLFVESLRAVSTIIDNTIINTSTGNREKEKNNRNLQEHMNMNVCNKSMKQGASSISITSSKKKTNKDVKDAKDARKKKQGIVIKLQKIQSTTSKNLYKIIDSTVSTKKDNEVLPNKEKIQMKMATIPKENKNKKRHRNEDVEDSCLCNDNNMNIVSSTPLRNNDQSDGSKTANFNSDSTSSTSPHTAIPRNSFYFVTPEEKDKLSDYMFLLMAQVKRGELTTKDLDNARRKNSALVVGYLGLRCRHCGGTERGHYFPTTSKNLQACPSMIFKHLMSCHQCPSRTKQQLKVLKTKHKTQVLENGSGIQITFFNTLWQRIRDSNFNGGDDETRNEVFTILQNMLDVPKDVPIQKPTIKNTTVISDKVPNENENENPKHPIDPPEAEKVIDKSPSESSIQSSTKSSAPPRISAAQIDMSRIANEDVPIVTTENHFDIMKYTSSMPDLSSSSSANINALFESQQSLNVTIDMLDAVADEILNSKPYPYMSEQLNKRTVSPPPDQIHWDKASVRVLRDMVESDEDYRGMINILANLTPEKKTAC